MKKVKAVKPAQRGDRGQLLERILALKAEGKKPAAIAEQLRIPAWKVYQAKAPTKDTGSAGKLEAPAAPGAKKGPWV